MTRRVWRAVTDESAATAVEYAVMVALVAVVIIGGVTAVGDSVSDIFAGVDLESTSIDDGAIPTELADVDTEPADSSDDSGEIECETAPEAGNSGNDHPQGGNQGGGQGGPPVEPPGAGSNKKP